MKNQTSMLSSAIAGAGFPWLGLVAVALGWRWTSPTIAGAAWDQAWLYTNMMLTMALFIITPMIAARGAAESTQTSETEISDLRWNMMAMLLAALPILVAAGWLSHIHAAVAVHTVLIELALAIFVIGLSAWIIRLRDPGRAMATGLAVGIFLFPPGIWLIQASTFPWLTGGAWSNWINIFPAAMISHISISHGESSGPLPWLICIYPALGILLFFSPTFATACRHRRLLSDE